MFINLFKHFLFHWTGIPSHRRIKSTPAKDRLEDCEAGEEDEDRAPCGGDSP